MTAPIIRISEWRMRRRFNTGRYYERTRNGDLTAVVKRDSIPPALSFEPTGTRSQEVSYIDGNNDEVARVHQYVRPDGSLGASGYPDPKRIYENGKLYRLRPSPKNGRERIQFYLSDLRDRIFWSIGLEVD